MAGKRRWPAVLALFAAAALVMLPTSRGVDSPRTEPLAAAVEEAEPLPAAESEGEEEPPAEESLPPEPPKPPEPAQPVPQTPVVADTYFDEAVFFGDSRTDGFRLYSGLDRGSYYFATGATVESVFTKEVETVEGKMPLLDALAQIEAPPERIFVMLGVNELGWAKSENFHDYYVALIERLRQDHPEADILVQSILPVSKLQEEKKTYVNNTRIARYNEIIRQVCGETDTPLLDVAGAVADEEGFLRSDWTYDGVHLNKKGCAAWLDYLRTHAVNYEVYAEDDAPTPVVDEAA